MKARTLWLMLMLLGLVVGLMAGCGSPEGSPEAAEQAGGKPAAAAEAGEADVDEGVGDDGGESASLDQDDDVADTEDGGDDDVDAEDADDGADDQDAQDDTDDVDDDDDDDPVAPGGGICGAIPPYGQATLSSVEEITSGALIDQLEQMGKIEEVYVYRTGDAATQVKEHYVQAMEDAGWAMVFEMDVAGDLLLIWSKDDLMAQLVIGSDEGLTTFILGCGPNG